MHSSKSSLALAFSAVLVLGACERPAQVVTPPPVIVNSTPGTPGTPGAPGPAGATGESGTQGRTGDAGTMGATGKPGTDATVIVVQPPASAPTK